MTEAGSLKTRARRWLFRAAAWTGLLRLFAFLNRRKVAILYYHGVSARETFPGIENHVGMHIRASMFRRHLQHIGKRYHVLSLSDLIQAFRNRVPLPPSSVVLTFDDGYENNATVALPLLREAGMTATFFLSTGYIGGRRGPWYDQVEQTLNADRRTRVEVHLAGEKVVLPAATSLERKAAFRRIVDHCKRLRPGEIESWLATFFETNGIAPPVTAGDYRFMTWDQVRELYAAGMEIGSHTVSHAIVTRLGEREMLKELNEARLACEEALGVPCEAFAYPNGQPGDFSHESGELLRSLQFSAALTTVHGLNAPGDDLFTLKRVGAGDDTSVEELVARLSGFTEFVLKLRRGFRR